MILDAVSAPAALLSRRYLVVDYLPTYAGVLFVLVIVWAGAPVHYPRFSRAWDTAAHLGVAQLVLLSLVVILLTLLLARFQLLLVRAFEGQWPQALGRKAAVKHQYARRESGKTAADLSSVGRPPTAAEEQAAGEADAGWRARFPVDEQMIQATAFGNVLAAMEENAGRRYGHEAAVTWSRLYLVLNDRTRHAVDQRRTAMDASIRIAATALLMAIVNFGLLVGHGGLWTLLTLIPLGIAAASYQGAIQGALAYAEAVRVAFDLCRFELLSALHLPLPETPADEQVVNLALSANWKQDVPLGPAVAKFEHPRPEPTGSQPPGAPVP